MPNQKMPAGKTSADLECVMLNIEPLPVLRLMHQGAADELFYGTTPELKYAQGAVAETKAHATLLFGIHPRPTYRRDVDAVLKGWEPETIFIENVTAFPIRDEDQEYHVLIGKVKVTRNLLEARARLETLDFTDRYAAQYQPHVTLAYVKRGKNIGTWIENMDIVYGGTMHAPIGLNYGD